MERANQTQAAKASLRLSNTGPTATGATPRVVGAATQRAATVPASRQAPGAVHMKSGTAAAGGLLESRGIPAAALAGSFARKEEKRKQEQQLKQSDCRSSSLRTQQQQRQTKQQPQQIQSRQPQQQSTRGGPPKRQLEHRLRQQQPVDASKDVEQQHGKKEQQTEHQKVQQMRHQGGREDAQETQKKKNGEPQQQQQTQEKTEHQQETKKVKEKHNSKQQEEKEKDAEEQGKVVCGSGLQTVGGETPVEQCPEEKFTVEKDVLLCDSIIWKMLEEYYKRMAIAAWSQELVPSFVTSNSRLCRSYARIIFAFLQDWYVKERKERGEKGRKKEWKEKDSGLRDEQQQQYYPEEAIRQQQHRGTTQHQHQGQPQDRQQQTDEEQQSQTEKKKKQRQDEWGQQEDAETAKQQTPLHGEEEKEEKARGCTRSTVCDEILNAEQEHNVSDTWKKTHPSWKAVLPSHSVAAVVTCGCAVPPGDTRVAAAAASSVKLSVAAGEASCTASVSAAEAGGVKEQLEATARLPRAAAVVAMSASPSTAPSLSHPCCSCLPPCAAADSVHCPAAAAEYHPGVLILEIGGGHGRFTFLLLKALLQFSHLFDDLDMPAHPFLYVFSDVASANVCFCEQHPALQPFIHHGWLDFAVFDGNQDKGQIFLRKKQKYVSKGTPIVAIANYVFDSLLTDAWRITPGEATEYHRAGISIYSPQVERNCLNPDIMLRMSVGWHWHPVEDLSLVFPSSSDPASAAMTTSNAAAAAVSAAAMPAAAVPPTTDDEEAIAVGAGVTAAASAAVCAADTCLSLSSLCTSASSSRAAVPAAAAAAGGQTTHAADAAAEGSTSVPRDTSEFNWSSTRSSHSTELLDSEETAEGSTLLVVSHALIARKQGEEDNHQQQKAEDKQLQKKEELEKALKLQNEEDTGLPPTASSSRETSSFPHNNDSNISSTSSSSSNTKSTTNPKDIRNSREACSTGNTSTSSTLSSPSSLSSYSPLSSSSLSSRCAGWRRDPAVRQVLERYREMNQVLSLVLPVGAFSLLRSLLELSNYNFFCLIGDKGYPSYEEFIGVRDPHIAVHGSVSFMLNLHAIRLYFDCIGGFSLATPYRDTFQVTALWCCGRSSNNSNSSSNSSTSTSSSSASSNSSTSTSSSSTSTSRGACLDGERSSSRCRREMPRSQAAFIADAEDMPPDSLIQWQRSCQERGAGIKEALSLLRYSGHDPDVFLHLSSSFVKHCVQPFINPRTEHDILFDLEKVHRNWYKLKKGEDLPDACAHICMKLGRCSPAVHYLSASTTECSETLHASTFVNLAACHKVLGQFKEGICCCQQALALQPHYAQAEEMLSTLQMCQRPFRVGLIGLGYWMRMEAVHLLRREKRVSIAAVYSYKEAEARSFLSLSFSSFEKEIEEGNVAVYAGATGLKQLLERKDIFAVVLDVHAHLMPSFLSRVLQAQKHVLTRSPLALSLSAGWKLVNIYKEHAAKIVWHAVDNGRNEEAFFQAKELLQQLGILSSFSFHCVTHALVPPAAPAGAAEFRTFPYTIKEHLALELLRCVVAVRTVTGGQLFGLGCFFSGQAEPLGGSGEGKEEAVRSDDEDAASFLEKQTRFPEVAATSSFATPGTLSAVSTYPKRTLAPQKGSPLLSGWLEFADTRDSSRRIPGSFVVTNAAGDSSIKYTFLCTAGALELSRSVSSWKLHWTTKDSLSSPGAHSLAIQSIGHQNSHDAWLTDLFHAMRRSEETEQKQSAPVKAEENSGLVDVSINSALGDCAIIEAILGSIQKEGSPARFTAVNKVV